MLFYFLVIDKLGSYSESDAVEQGDNNDGTAADATPASAAVIPSGTAAPLVEEWEACVRGLNENYVLANENYKYLGTLQEFLLVSG